MILSVTLSKPGKICEQKLGRPYIRIKIHYANTETGQAWFAEFFTQTQAFHRKFSQQELNSFLNENIGKTFLNCTERTETEQITILTNKKGKITELRKKLADDSVSSASKQEHPNVCHFSSINDCGIENTRIAGLNRIKNYIIEEGTPVPFLISLGIMTDTGKVIAAKYDKFRQINRFLEYINDILPDVLRTIRKEDKNSPDKIRSVRIVDFGCGKAYLTFAIYYFLTAIKKIPVEIKGLDLKKDVITYCNTLAKNLNCKGLTFEVGDIANCTYKNPPDIVITLHACDTATDYALSYAIKNKAKAILSVPCCQHELNRQLNENKQYLSGTPFEALLKYGIIQERFAALATDTLRAEYLEKSGYDVQILEFIDMSHTPKNLLIRAVLKNATDKGGKQSPSEKDAEQCARRLTEELHVSPTLRELLQD